MYISICTYQKFKLDTLATFAEIAYVYVSTGICMDTYNNNYYNRDYVRNIRFKGWQDYCKVFSRNELMWHTLYVSTYVYNIYMYVCTLYTCRLYLGGIELEHIRIWTGWAWDLYYSTALVEAVKSLVPLDVIGHGKVPYQKPQLKSMVHGIYIIIIICI